MATYRSIIDSFKARRLSETDIQQRLSDLMLLFDFSSSLNQISGIKEIVDLLLLTLMGYTASRRAVFFRTAEQGMELVESKGYRTGAISAATYPCPPLNDCYVHQPETTGEWSALCDRLQLTLLVPLLRGDELAAVVGLGGKSGAKGYGPQELEIVCSVVQMSTGALSNALARETLQSLNRRLSLKIYQLNTLFELSKDFNAAWDSETVFRILGTSLIGQLLVSRCVVLTITGGTVLPQFARGVRLPATDLKPYELKESLELKTPLLCNELPESALKTVCINSKLHIAIPMVLNEEVRGVVLLGEKKSRRVYDAEDFDFITTLSNLALLADENARMQHQMIEKQRMEKELAIARDIQIGLLPRSIPKIEGYQICSVFEPCYTVGGDYFDFLPLSDHETAIAIADVSGKSTPAALLMASIQASLRTLTAMQITNPRVTIERINLLLCENQTKSNKYVTFFFAVLNHRTHMLTYVNAGHCYPLVLKANGEMERLETGGTILGFFRDVIYRTGFCKIDRGDVVVLYTDGVSELANVDDEEFGVERIVHHVRRTQSGNVSAMKEDLLAALQEHRAGGQQGDDITFILLKRS